MVGLADRLREIHEAPAGEKGRLLAELLEAAAPALRAGLMQVDHERAAVSASAAWMEINLTLPGGWFIRLEVGKARS